MMLSLPWESLWYLYVSVSFHTVVSRKPCLPKWEESPLINTKVSSHVNLNAIT